MAFNRKLVNIAKRVKKAEQDINELSSLVETSSLNEELRIVKRELRKSNMTNGEFNDLLDLVVELETFIRESKIDIRVNKEFNVLGTVLLSEYDATDVEKILFGRQHNLLKRIDTLFKLKDSDLIIEIFEAMIRSNDTLIEYKYIDNTLDIQEIELNSKLGIKYSRHVLRLMAACYIASIIKELPYREVFLKKIIADKVEQFKGTKFQKQASRMLVLEKAETLAGYIGLNALRLTKTTGKNKDRWPFNEGCAINDFIAMTNDIEVTDNTLKKMALLGTDKYMELCISEVIAIQALRDYINRSGDDLHLDNFLGTEAEEIELYNNPDPDDDYDPEDDSDEDDYLGLGDNFELDADFDEDNLW